MCSERVARSSAARTGVYGPAVASRPCFRDLAARVAGRAARRHVIALDELTVEEAAYLGPLLRAATAALRQVLGCSKTYVGLFAEAEGFAHVHFHVVPCGPDLDQSLRGPRVFGLLGGDPSGHLPNQVMDQTAASLGQALRLDS